MAAKKKTTRAKRAPAPPRKNPALAAMDALDAADRRAKKTGAPLNPRGSIMVPHELRRRLVDIANRLEEERGERMHPLAAVLEIILDEWEAGRRRREK